MEPAGRRHRKDGKWHAGGIRPEVSRRRAIDGELCAAKAKRETDFDVEGARAAALEFIRAEGRASGENVVAALKLRGFVPHDDRAFGPVFAALARGGEIRCVGYVVRKKGHGTAGGRVWEAVR